MRVIYPFAGHRIGGSHLSALLLIRELPRVGIEPIVVLHGRGRLHDLLTRERVDFIELFDASMLRKRTAATHARRLLTMAPRAAWLTRRFNARAVHTNDPDIHLSWRPVSVATRVPQIWHQRGLRWPNAPWSDPWRPESVIAISQAVYASLPASARSVASIIDNPFRIDPMLDLPSLEESQERRRKARARLGVPPDPPILAVVGHYWRRKRQDLVPRLLHELDERHGVHVLAVLAGEDREGLRSEIDRSATSLGVRERVLHLGFVERVDDVYDAADVVWAPAEDEPFGRTLVEAMARARPLVAADSGAHPEIVGRIGDGLLHPPGDVVHAGNHVAKLLSDPSYGSAIALSGQASARRRYSVERHASDVADVIRSTVRGRVT